MVEESVGDIIHRMQRFAWADYVVFVFMLAISAAVGIYWGFFKKQSTQQDYLLGGRNMKTLPVAMSLVASFVSGITLLGSPTEMYMYGTQYAFIVGGIFLMSFVMTQVYLPVFHNLGITSNYEYLSLRFDNRVRLFGSVLFTFALIGWLPIVIYVPALAFNQVTGIDIHIVTPIVCVVCIFYTSAGGLQAVVWTDVIQISVMFCAMALVAVKGTLDVGGVAEVWRINREGGRIEPPIFDPSLYTRHTVWGLVVGGLFYWLQANAVNQTMIQRYLALPTLRNAKWAVIIFCIGISALYAFCLYCGLLIYARFHDCDPLTTKLAKAKDQLLPLFVMDVLGEYPGLSGVFVAGIFSAALSSLSTSLNSMSAVVLEDFYKPFFKRSLTEGEASWLMRSVVVLMGALCLCLVFVVEKMGTILQLTMTLEAITNGPQLGVFTMGILMPWVDSVGALVGGASGLLVMSWWCLNAQLAIVSGALTYPHKPLSVAGCDYNYTRHDTALLSAHDHTVATPAHLEVHTSCEAEPPVAALYRVSYMWYTVAGALVTVCVGSAVAVARRTLRRTAHVAPPARLAEPVAALYRVSYMWYTVAGALVTVCVGSAVAVARRTLRRTAHVAPPARLLAPQLHRFYPAPSHPTDENYIRAYGGKAASQKNYTSVNMKTITEGQEGS